MDSQEGEVNACQNNTICVLEQNECKEHRGKCPNVWIMTPPLHKFLHHLPGELQRIVIAKTVVPQPPCIKHVFGHCYDPWECKAGVHTFSSAHPRVTPSTCYTSKCQLLRQEGHKAFFLNNIFIFKPDLDTSLNSLRGSATVRERFYNLHFNHESHRDDRVTRLLDFIDSPEWKRKGSKRFQNHVENGSYTNVDEYRYAIRHLVFRGGDNRDHLPGNFLPTWGWALKVDWKTLPNLQTLVIDLKGYSYRQQQNSSLQQELYNEQLEAGAKRMECLKLKSFIIYGLCSGPEYWGKKQHQRKMEVLFLPALTESGKLEFRDEECFVEW